MRRPVLLSAGGTGGHLFPAQALGEALRARGVPVELVTDTRAARFDASFPARAVHRIASATPTGAGAASKARAALVLGRGTLSALALLKRIDPAIVVGFGGYPTVPPMLAARLLRIPAILHEQNAVMGRANRLLSAGAMHIATGFPDLGGIAPSLRDRIVHTGNPVRPVVIVASATAYPSTDGVLRLLVTGGSQGARVMTDVVPAAVTLLDAATRARLTIVQQARGEDEARAKAAYASMSVAAEVAAFFPDLPARMAQAHLVIARSGASTVSELAVIGRPAILVPFPFALDQDQAANARVLASSGAAEIVAQADFSPAWLADALRRALDNPAALAARAASARRAGVGDAAARLADLVMSCAGLTAAPEPKP